MPKAHSKKPIAVDGFFTSKPYGAGKEARTLDLYLGKVSLYQLSYSRIDLVAWGGIEPPTQGFSIQGTASGGVCVS